MIRNINERLGDAVDFETVDEMAQAVKALGYMPEDGLVEGRDYIDVSAAAAALGRKGRAVNSPAQVAAARANGAKGGRPKMRRVMVKGRYGDGEAVEIILRDGKTATRGQYETAVRRLGGHNPVNSGLVLVDKTIGEIPVYDGDQPWAMLS